VAKYLKGHQKRQLLGMLRTKKELEEAIANGEVRLQAVKKSLGQVEQQHLDVQMVEVLDGANKYMASVQEKLEEMDWRAVVMQSQQ
jgi:HEPN domain-containing protein